MRLRLRLPGRFRSEIQFRKLSCNLFQMVYSGFVLVRDLRGCQKVSSSRPIMNSRRLWNAHQRHKFLRAEAFRDILKLRVSEMVFPGVFKRNFPPRMLCCLVRILATLGTMPSKCRRHSTTSHGSNVSHFFQNWSTDALQFYSMVLIFC